MAIDRDSISQRPTGSPAMKQQWNNLLFMHWPAPVPALRSLIPEPLHIDVWKGRAWIGIVPFAMRGVRPAFTPPMPGLSAFHELNVRTYVHYNGVPGVYFFSLDASSQFAVWAARRFYHLPYYIAEMTLTRDGEDIFCSSRRTHRDAPPAEFEARWRPGRPIPKAPSDSLAFFLTERYCLYTVHRKRLYRCRIHHGPWALQEAELRTFRSRMLFPPELPEPEDAPLLHYAATQIVDIWPLKPVEAFSRTRVALERLTRPPVPVPEQKPV